MHPSPPQPFKVREDASNPSHAILSPLNMHRVGAKIDSHTEHVFHQSQIFVAGPKQGLKVRRDLQSYFQTASMAAGSTGNSLDAIERLLD